MHSNNHLNNVNSLAEALNINLSDMYAIFLKTQNYHWNLKGQGFLSTHEFLDKWYHAQLEMIDEVAERIRSLDHPVYASLVQFSKYTNVHNPLEKVNIAEMLKDLLHDQEYLVNKALNASLKLAQKEGDEVTADILIETMRAYEKHSWFIRSML